MHDVIDGRCHLVIAEHRSLPGELEVGREDYGLPLVGFRDDLEERPGVIGDERQEAWLVYDKQLGPADLGELPVEPALAAHVPIIVLAVPLTRRDTAIFLPICLILPGYHAQFPVTICVTSW